MIRENKEILDVSVIIPVFKPNNSIKLLMSCLLNNQYAPNEIILVDSGSNYEIVNYFEKLSTKYKNFVYKKSNHLFPGSARNLGIKMSKSKYVTFFDVNTLPTENWLKNSYSYILNKKIDILLGLRKTLANTYIKKIIKYSTYGESSYIAVTGSIVLRSILIKENLFFINFRAGEDIDWLLRIKKKKHEINTSPILYNGLSENILFNIRKWYSYSISYSNIKKDFNNQKKMYFFSILYIFLPYWFLPINYFLYFLLFNIIIYSLFFSIIRPFRSDVKISEILPFNWIAISLTRIIFDISKFPGLIFGFFKLFKK